MRPSGVSTNMRIFVATFGTSNRCLPRVCLSQSPSKPRRAYEPTRERPGDFLGHAPLNLLGGHVERIQDMYVRLHPASSLHAIFFPFA